MTMSFYSAQFAVVFNDEDNGVISGIITENRHNSPRQEFKGISHFDGVINVCFITNWTTYPEKKLQYETVFSGTITDTELRLKWMHLVNGVFHDEGSATLWRDFEMLNNGMTELNNDSPIHFIATVHPELN